MGLNDFIFYENTIQARAGFNSDKKSYSLGLIVGSELLNLSSTSGVGLKPVPLEGDIENYQGKLYYTNNVGYREIISEDPLLLRGQENSGGGVFFDPNIWNQLSGFSVTETGYYNLQIGLRVRSEAPANNQIRITENNIVKQYHNGLTDINALILFQVTGITEDFFFFNEKDVFFFTAGSVYNIEVFSDNAAGFHNEGIRTLSLKKLNYSFSSSSSNAGGGV